MHCHCPAQLSFAFPHSPLMKKWTSKLPGSLPAPSCPLLSSKQTMDEETPGKAEPRRLTCRLQLTLGIYQMCRYFSWVFYFILVNMPVMWKADKVGFCCYPYSFQASSPLAFLFCFSNTQQPLVVQSF